MIDSAFWKNKRVFITGHTGFKGSWLCLWLSRLGAKVIGYSLSPPTNPSLFELAKVKQCLDKNITGDVRDATKLANSLRDSRAEIVIHMAAQPLVRDSYKIPVDTYAINVMGTVNLLEAVRVSGKSVRAVINVTTDKVYENREWVWGYRENEPLGGYDPYSNSKACSELVTAAYRNSFFNPDRFSEHKCAIATARAGNVIGGGDWAMDRIVPDCIRALKAGKPVIVRNPDSIRPWQHVLEPLSGYLCLAEKLYKKGASFAQSWNFGPNENDCKPVEYLVKTICAQWGPKATFSIAKNKGLHEATFLKLDCSKAASALGWRPRWNIDATLRATVAWYKTYHERRRGIFEFCLEQIREIESPKEPGFYG
jgi:CDP-glucose 4,6-dehydratase